MPRSGINQNELSQQYVSLEKLRMTINEAMSMLRSQYPQNEIIDDKEIVVKIQALYCLNLDLVDLPGLVATIPHTGTTQNVPEVTKQLALNVINAEKDVSMFLVVNDIRVPPNQSRGCELVQATGAGRFCRVV